MNKNIVLIDADSLCYIGKSTDSIQTIVQKVDDKINAILEETKADYYCLFISKGRYFRYDLTMKPSDDMYKGTRTYDSQPYKKVIKAYLEAQWGAISYPSVEADDAIAYWMNKKLYLNYLKSGKNKIDTFIDSFELINSEQCSLVMAAVDKDLLQSIRGVHLNYNKKTGPDSWEMVWIDTSEEMSNKFYREQLLMGDASDGIVAFKGVGPVRAEKLMSTWTEGHAESHILSLYIEYYKGDVPKAIYEFQKNYRLLHMLNTDEDWIREVGYTPELPTIREVIKQNTIIKNEF